MESLKIKKLSPKAKLPARATENSAGYDLYACIEAPVLVPAGGRATIPTGVAAEIGASAAGFVFGRSGLGIRHGIVPSNAVGVIDGDYRGEILVGLSNHSGTDYWVQPLERVAQLVLLPVLTPPVLECGELTDTARGGKGFGSTGK